MENLNLLIGQIQPILQELAKNLGVAREFLWEVLIKQQYIDGFTSLFLAIIGLVGLWGIYKFSKWLYKKDKDFENNRYKDSYHSDNLGWIIFVTLIGIVCIILFLCGIIETINHFANPEYQALKDIMNMINQPRLK